MENRIEPALGAELVLDGEQSPVFLAGSSARKHFKIRLFVRNAPADAVKVTYALHSSYINPIREIPRGTADFEEFITSYGDYPVTAVVSLRNGESLVLKRDLKDLLSQSKLLNPKVLDAINLISQF